MIRRLLCFSLRRQTLTLGLFIIFVIMNSIFIFTHTSTPSIHNKARNINITQVSKSPAESYDYLDYLNFSVTFPEVPPIQVNLIKFTYTPDICNDSFVPDILIIVHSDVKNFKNREVFRNTLGRHSQYNGLTTKVIFVTGESRSKAMMNTLKEEQMSHGDVLTIAMVDKYTKMVYKAIGWMKWVSSACGTVRHVIKIDDDTFLHMYQISKLYKTCENTTIADPICTKMSCLLWKNFKPHRKGKYSLGESEYSRDYFPPFCPGVAIFIPGSMVDRLLEASRHVQFLWLDDVYLTGLLMEYLKEEHHNFGGKMINTILKQYKTIISGKMYVGHFNGDVRNGVYQSHWDKIEKKSKE